jgi:general secretion pathway protein C
MQKWIIPLNIFLTFLIIASLALIASDLISFRLTRLYPKTAPKGAAPSLSPMVAEDLMSFAPILERGLFGKAAQGKLTPVVQQAATAPGAAPAPSLGDLILLGTAVGSHRETFALVQKAGKEERVFRLGDTVFEAGPLVAVGKDSADILVNGKRTKIYSPNATGADAAAKPAQPATPAGGTGLAAQVGAGSYVIDQRALNASLDNIGQAMTDARLLPSIKDGKVEGFRASEVKPQGIFGTIGIKNGDILRAINDFPIDSPEKAIQSFASLKGQTRIKLDLVRDGQPTTFNYDIR